MHQEANTQNLTTLADPLALRAQADEHMALSKRYTRAYIDRDFSEHTQGQLMRLQNAHYEIAMQLRTVATAHEETNR